jgi:hypothetical protein
MSVKRFVKEYAAHKIREIKNNNLISEKTKTEKEMFIIRIVSRQIDGFITIDEAMHLISTLLGRYNLPFFRCSGDFVVVQFL